MRGRPKLEDSRDNQYRVRLNDEENEMLSYASLKTGRPKSEIFRLALVDYYNKVRLTELNLESTDEEAWDLGKISLKRVIKCPFCLSQIRIDLEDESQVTCDERDMGPETLYEFDFEGECPSCGRTYRVTGYVSEYPQGALNSEKINVKMTEPLSDIPVSELPEQVIARGKETVEKLLAGNKRQK
jgi:predicted DNA-binding protein